jgi:hypothetical protein
MYKLRNRGSLALVLLGCAGLAAVSPSQVVGQRFVAEVTAGWDSYQVCEHHAPSVTRESFLARALGLDTAFRPRVRESKELTVRETSASPALHLGIAELEFTSAEAAARLHARGASTGPRFLAGTKILTRYVTLRQEQRVLVVYSETHLQPKVRQFLEGLEARAANVWHQR